MIMVDVTRGYKSQTIKRRQAAVEVEHGIFTIAHQTFYANKHEKASQTQANFILHKEE